MRHVIQGITIEHFSLPAFPPRISEGPIYIEDKLRVSLFFVPRGAEMPLHDHPGMFVLCKILKGRLIRDSFKLNSSYWQFAFPQQFMKVPTVLIQGKFQNKVLPSVWATKTTGLVKENDVDTVTPDTNLHRFVALEDSIFFDVISPDYDHKEVFLNHYEERGSVNKNGEVLLQMKPLKTKHVERVNVDLIL
jgi:hypothetical protein